MEIGRRIYYNLSTGDVILDTGERCGDVIETTIDSDYAFYPELSGHSTSDTGVMQLTYGQYDTQFQTCESYKVNLTTIDIDFTMPPSP